VGNPGPLKWNEIGVIGFCSSFRGRRGALEPGICFSLRSGFRVHRRWSRRCPGM